MQIGDTVVRALRTPIDDPDLYLNIDAATEQLDKLVARMTDVVNELCQSEVLDEKLELELDDIRAELLDLADALQDGVMEDVHETGASPEESAVTAPILDDATVEQSEEAPTDVIVNTNESDIISW